MPRDYYRQVRNIIALKGCSPDKDPDKDRVKILIAAHMDEIGLMVKILKTAFKVYQCGGIDPRTIRPGGLVHGKKELFGVIGAKPPHLQEPEEQKKAIKMEDMARYRPSL